MAEQNDKPVRIRRIYIKKGESLKSIYAKRRRSFTAADLQKYTEVEEGIPAEQVLAELEAIHREGMQKRRREEAATMPGPHNGGRRYEVICSQAIAESLGHLQRRASRSEGGKGIAAAFRQIVLRLGRNPNTFGEPLHRLPGLRVQVRTCVVRPLVVDFAVSEERPLVFLKGVALLSHRPVSALAAEGTTGSGSAGRKGPRAERHEKRVRVPVMYVKKGESLKSIYARARRAFTAADLAKCADLDEPTVPLEQIIAELEAIQREEPQKPKKKQQKKKKD